MKKLLSAFVQAMKLLFILEILALMVIYLTSCEQDEFLKTDCAIYDLGTVIVRNSSGIDLIVDVTFNEATENAPIVLHYVQNAVNLTYFRELPQGSVVVWWRYDDQDWQHSLIDVESCEECLYVITENDL